MTALNVERIDTVWSLVKSLKVSIAKRASEFLNHFLSLKYSWEEMCKFWSRRFCGVSFTSHKNCLLQNQDKIFKTFVLNQGLYLCQIRKAVRSILSISSSIERLSNGWVPRSHSNLTKQMSSLVPKSFRHWVDNTLGAHHR